MIFQVGIWHDITGINFFRNFTETYSEIVESLQNKTLVVTTIMVTRFIGKPSKTKISLDPPTP